MINNEVSLFLSGCQIISLLVLYKIVFCWIVFRRVSKSDMSELVAIITVTVKHCRCWQCEDKGKRGMYGIQGLVHGIQWCRILSQQV
jgi:hypothetical protein